jgi:excisionase family DNA binding protein
MAAPDNPFLTSAPVAAPVVRGLDVADASGRASQTIEHECITAQELASWLRVNRKTVYEYAARNVIPCRRLGRRLVFSRPAVAAWLARSSTVDAPRAFASGRR